MWALIVTITLNLQSYPMFTLPDGQPVYMRTTVFKVALGQFATRTECEAYTAYQNAGFIFSYTDTSGTPQSITFPLSSLSYTVNECSKVL